MTSPNNKKSKEKTVLVKKILLALGVIVLLTGILQYKNAREAPSKNIPVNSGKIVSGSFDQNKLRPEAEWKKILTTEQFHILREKGTEIPFTGALDKEKRKGTYYSVGCNEPLFRSEQKYDSGTGWPSFWDPISPDALVLQQEAGMFGEERIEVLDRCGGHLGHVFNDGPDPTGKRYCMNSAALKFIPDKDQ